ncbi:hypothetical protein ACE5KN_14380 [Paenibacillus terreus]
MACYALLAGTRINNIDARIKSIMADNEEQRVSPLEPKPEKGADEA